ncbi:MAG: hypothetical protein SFV54_10110 [Bryobacteraceae bacterium]|nr:hypothetical protein [Bryobacteraceae bacterium]
MTRARKIYWAKVASILCLIPVLVWAYGFGPPPRRTGAPGDRICLDSGCHVGTRINDSAAITLTNSATTSVPAPTVRDDQPVLQAFDDRPRLSPGTYVQVFGANFAQNTYTPGGPPQRWTVRVADSAARRFGFQLTARLASDESNGQAGDLNPSGNSTEIVCEDDRNKPQGGCANNGVQFARHFQVPRTDGTWSFDWTPPSTNVGDVRVYIAGNASVSGQGNSRIHLRNFTVSPNGRLWEGRDFQGNNAPTSLDGWGVTFNDIPGYVYFVRGGVAGAPDQINVQVPNIPTTGNINVVVTGPGGLRSNAATLPAAAVSPAILAPAGFRVNNVQYAAANLLSELNAGRVVYVGRTGLVGGVEFRPARPGETIVFYAVGCGPVTPSVPPGQIATAATQLASPFTVRLGGQAITPLYAGLYGGFVGLYRFDITVPDLSNGDHRLELTIDGVSVPEAFLTVQR